MLFDPARHEPLSAAPWDAGAAQAAIERIVADAWARESPDTYWPTHPLDREDGDPSDAFTMLYMGAAGVLWALDRLARAGATARRFDFRPWFERLEARNVAQLRPWGYGVESYPMGRSGVLLTQFRHAPSAAIADRLAASVAANVDHPSREMLWGAPGTMHAAVDMHERTGEARWRDLFRRGAAALATTLEIVSGAGCSLWEQQLYGQHIRYLGAGHGFAGNAAALARGSALLDTGEWRNWRERIVETVQATVLHDGPHANWPATFVEPAPASRRLLVQWCHGAPGFITGLADVDDTRLDALLAAGGELVWAAGPLAKGPGLCHGTAGNGYAFLKLYRRTGDARWLDRARAFAMHAIAQSERHAAQYGIRRYSLWTGDAGVALYLWSCLRGTAAWPALDRDDD